MLMLMLMLMLILGKTGPIHVFGLGTTQSKQHKAWVNNENDDGLYQRTNEGHGGFKSTSRGEADPPVRYLL
jgi:hypothetical protein